MSTIYVLNKDGKPLMPTTRGGHVRHLSNGMFITIDDALAFIPLDNIIGMKLPNEIVYP